MLVILKIPVVYLCAIVWWAIRAEPQPLEGAGTLAPVEPPVDGAPQGGPGQCDWSARRAHLLRRGPPPRSGRRAGRPGRVSAARVRVPR